MKSNTSDMPAVTSYTNPAVTSYINPLSTGDISVTLSPGSEHILDNNKVNGMETSTAL